MLVITHYLSTHHFFQENIVQFTFQDRLNIFHGDRGGKKRNKCNVAREKEEAKRSDAS